MAVRAPNYEMPYTTYLTAAAVPRLPSLSASGLVFGGIPHSDRSHLFPRVFPKTLLLLPLLLLALDALVVHLLDAGPPSRLLEFLLRPHLLVLRLHVAGGFVLLLVVSQAPGLEN